MVLPLQTNWVPRAWTLRKLLCIPGKPFSPHLSVDLQPTHKGPSQLPPPRNLPSLLLFSDSVLNLSYDLTTFLCVYWHSFMNVSNSVFYVFMSVLGSIWYFSASNFLALLPRPVTVLPLICGWMSFLGSPHSWPFCNQGFTPGST